MIMHRFLGILGKIFHGYKSGVLKNPFTGCDAHHFLKAILVYESESVVELPFEIIDNP
jgi:hypothetical protein